MFKQLFATMHEVLDDIIAQYPAAAGVKKHELTEQLDVLKSMSVEIIEEWIRFEEKMEKFTGGAAKPHPHPHQPHATLSAADDSAAYGLESFEKGKGYFQLYMFDEAIRHFEHVVRVCPDFLLARLYLALGYLTIGNDSEAYRHFQFLVPLTENAKIKAISLNAMGCIQMLHRNIEKALEYFRAAHETDPSLCDPIINMEVCLRNEGELQYGLRRGHEK